MASSSAYQIGQTWRESQDTVRVMALRWRRYGCEAEAVLTEQVIRELRNLREELEARSRMLRQDTVIRREH